MIYFSSLCSSLRLFESILETDFMLFKAPTSRSHAFLLFLGIALITRLPYFFKADIDWDEHTFLLLGQSVLDGHLPYTALLDNKPPFLWYSFAALAVLAQQSLFRLRLMGSVLVAGLALLSYINVRRDWDSRHGTIAGLVCIACLNLGAGGQAVMSEHLALLPLALAFTLLASASRTDRTLFCLGLTLTIAPLIRLNLAYFSLVSSLYLLVSSLWGSSSSRRDRLRQLTAFLLGITTVILLLIGPYALTGNLITLYRGMIQAALSFSREQSSLLGVLVQQIVTTFLMSKDSIALLILNWFVVLCLVPQGLAILKNYRSNRNFWPTQIFPPNKPHFYPVLWLSLLSIEYSILKTGVFYGHYNLQFAFLISLLLAQPIAQILEHKVLWKRLALGFVGLVFMVHHGLQYGLIVSHWQKTGTPAYGLSLQVSQLSLIHI